MRHKEAPTPLLYSVPRGARFSSNDVWLDRNKVEMGQYSMDST